MKAQQLMIETQADEIAELRIRLNELEALVAELAELRQGDPR
jgi:hypothetical protein